MPTNDVTRASLLRRFVQLRAAGHKMELLGWPAPELALDRLMRFVDGTAGRPSLYMLRAAFTFANERGEARLVVEAAKLLGSERLFENAYLCGQVMRARAALRMESVEDWQAFLSGTPTPRPQVLRSP